jgi:hypothetical protein
MAGAPADERTCPVFSRKALARDSDCSKTQTGGGPGRPDSNPIPRASAKKHNDIAVKSRPGAAWFPGAIRSYVINGWNDRAGLVSARIVAHLA